jgi:AAA domain
MDTLPARPDSTLAEHADLFVRLSDVERQPVRWLWDKRIPLGKVTFITGDPERGKSVVSLDLAARWSTGSPMPGETRAAALGTVLLVCAEDDIADTIRPRLEAAGADLDRIVFMPLRRNDDGIAVPLALPDDLPRLRAAVVRSGATLGIIDTIAAHLSESIATNNDASVRRATTPLADLAQQSACAIVGIRHFNKASDMRAIYRGGGSIAFSGAARSELVVEEHPDHPGVLVLARLKNNLAAKGKVTGMRFRLVSDELYDAPVVRWDGPEAIDVETLLRGRDARLEAPERDEAEHFLATVLADGPRPAEAVLAEAGQSGIAERTRKRAKSRLGVVSSRGRDATGKTTGWTWGLPPPPESQP